MQNKEPHKGTSPDKNINNNKDLLDQYDFENFDHIAEILKKINSLDYPENKDHLIDFLSKIRLQLGFSYEDLQKKSNIPYEFVKAIFFVDIDKLPSSAHFYGYANIILKFLKLDKFQDDVIKLIRSIIKCHHLSNVSNEKLVNDNSTNNHSNINKTNNIKTHTKKNSDSKFSVFFEKHKKFKYQRIPKKINFLEYLFNITISFYTKFGSLIVFKSYKYKNKLFILSIFIIAVIIITNLAFNESKITSDHNSRKIDLKSQSQINSIKNQRLKRIIINLNSMIFEKFDNFSVHYQTDLEKVFFIIYSVIYNLDIINKNNFFITSNSFDSVNSWKNYYFGCLDKCSIDNFNNFEVCKFYNNINKNSNININTSINTRKNEVYSQSSQIYQNTSSQSKQQILKITAKKDVKFNITIDGTNQNIFLTSNQFQLFRFFDKARIVSNDISYLEIDYNNESLGNFNNHQGFKILSFKK